MGGWVVWCNRWTLLTASLGLVLGLVPATAAAQNLTFAPPAFLNVDAATDAANDRTVDIVANGSGVWLAFWASATTSGSDSDVLVARSLDGGASWSAPTQLDVDGGTYVRYSGVPHAATDGAGTWIAVWASMELPNGSPPINRGSFMARSSDDGLTWTAPVPFVANAPGNANVSAASIATDRMGTWLVTWSTRDAIGAVAASTNSNIAVARSTDGGLTWAAPTPLNTDAATDGRNDLDPEIRTDGSTWLAVWDANHFGGVANDIEIVTARSIDAGITWSAPAALNTDAASDGAADYAPHVATNGGGAWVAVWSRGAESNALVARSVDDGITWTPSQRLNPNAVPGDERQDADPQIATDGRGTWAAVWSSSDALGSANGVTIANPLLALSLDDGATWSAPAPVNTDAFSGDCGVREDSDVHLASDGLGTWVVVWSRLANYCLQPPTRPDVELLSAHTVVTCGNRFVEIGEECDDGNPLAGDGCAPDCRFEPCRATPALDCRSTGTANASFKITNHVSRQLEWKWGRGTASRAEFGDPTKPGDDYHLCVYDGGHLVSATPIAAGGMCGSRACWDANASGYEFRETKRRPKSALLLLLKEGTSGKARLHFRARGAAVRMPPVPVGGGQLRVQLKHSGGPQCWEARFSAPFLRNDAAGFFARSD